MTPPLRFGTVPGVPSEFYGLRLPAGTIGGAGSKLLGLRPIEQGAYTHPLTDAIIFNYFKSFIEAVGVPEAWRLGVFPSFAHALDFWDLTFRYGKLPPQAYPPWALSLISVGLRVWSPMAPGRPLVLIAAYSGMPEHARAPVPDFVKRHYEETFT